MLTQLKFWSMHLLLFYSFSFSFFRGRAGFSPIRFFPLWYWGNFSWGPAQAFLKAVSFPTTKYTTKALDDSQQALLNPNRWVEWIRSWLLPFAWAPNAEDSNREERFGAVCLTNSYSRSHARIIIWKEQQVSWKGDSLADSYSRAHARMRVSVYVFVKKMKLGFGGAAYFFSLFLAYWV